MVSGDETSEQLEDASGSLQREETVVELKTDEETKKKVDKVAMTETDPVVRKEPVEAVESSESVAQEETVKADVTNKKVDKVAKAADPVVRKESLEAVEPVVHEEAVVKTEEVVAQTENLEGALKAEGETQAAVADIPTQATSSSKKAPKPKKESPTDLAAAGMFGTSNPKSNGRRRR